MYTCMHVFARAHTCTHARTHKGQHIARHAIVSMPTSNVSSVVVIILACLIRLFDGQVRRVNEQLGLAHTLF